LLLPFIGGNSLAILKNKNILFRRRRTLSHQISILAVLAAKKGSVVVPLFIKGPNEKKEFQQDHQDQY